MSKPCAYCEKWAPQILSLVRVVIAVSMLEHGGQKLFGYPEGAHGMPHFPLFSLAGIAGMLELAGGLLLLLGLFTRAAAFILSGEMAVAYFYAHFYAHGHIIIWPIHNGGELAIIYCFVLLYLSAAGGGPLGLDNLRKGCGGDEDEESPDPTESGTT